MKYDKEKKTKEIRVRLSETAYEKFLKVVELYDSNPSAAAAFLLMQQVNTAYTQFAVKTSSESNREMVDIFRNFAAAMEDDLNDARKGNLQSHPTLPFT